MKKHIPISFITSHWFKIRHRCKDKNNSYGSRGIKCLVSIDDLIALFKRDRAWRFHTPSPNRIKGTGNYSIDNIEWIEAHDQSFGPRAPKSTWVKYYPKQITTRIHTVTYKLIKSQAIKDNRKISSVIDILVANSLKKGLTEPMEE